MTIDAHQSIAPEPFRVIGAELIKDIIKDSYLELQDLVIETYRQHHAGETVNPDSYFLRYPLDPKKRIIALPAHIGGSTNVSGLKWIASYPDNIKHGLQRASATLILNDGNTGFPLACLESGVISATRTSISAVSALHFLKNGNKAAKRVGIIGNGFIARTLTESLCSLGWDIPQFSLFDLSEKYAASLKQHIQGLGYQQVDIESSLQDLIESCDVIITTTTAGAPYITDPQWLKHNPVILNLSLRDIGEDIILNANNILDDIGHCLKAETSPHLAFKKTGNTDFINGHFGQLIDGSLSLDKDKTTIFSPFGLGVLDIALGHFIYQRSKSEPGVITVPNFFGDQTRW